MDKLRAAYNAGYKAGLVAAKYSGSDDNRPVATFGDKYEACVDSQDIEELGQTLEMLGESADLYPYKWFLTADKGEELWEVWGSRQPKFSDNAIFELVYRS